MYYCLIFYFYFDFLLFTTMIIVYIHYAIYRRINYIPVGYKNSHRANNIMLHAHNPYVNIWILYLFVFI